MSDVYLIEIGETAVGLVARDDDGSYRFHAAVPEMNEIDGQNFAIPDLARRAARRLMDRRPAPAPAPAVLSAKAA